MLQGLRSRHPRGPSCPEAGSKCCIVFAAENLKNCPDTTWCKFAFVVALTVGTHGEGPQRAETLFLNRCAVFVANKSLKNRLDATML